MLPAKAWPAVTTLRNGAIPKPTTTVTCMTRGLLPITRRHWPCPGPGRPCRRRHHGIDHTQITASSLRPGRPLRAVRRRQQGHHQAHRPLAPVTPYTYLRDCCHPDSDHSAKMLNMAATASRSGRRRRTRTDYRPQTSQKTAYCGTVKSSPNPGPRHQDQLFDLGMTPSDQLSPSTTADLTPTTQAGSSSMNFLSHPLHSHPLLFPVAYGLALSELGIRTGGACKCRFCPITLFTTTDTNYNTRTTSEGTVNPSIATCGDRRYR
jgi:hypothetical protein